MQETSYVKQHSKEVLGMLKKSLLVSLHIGLICLVASGAVIAADLRDVLYDAWEIELYGFAEARLGYRTGDDPYEKDRSIAESRLQLDLNRFFNWGSLKLKGDFTRDQVKDRFGAELRELNVTLSPLDFMDLKIGRQVLTWGTGDLLFINDLFPKDWKSFFIGRDDEYLKAPSDAVKTSFFLDLVNLDVIYVPEFNPSIYIDGSRLSYWNPVLGRIAGRDFIFGDDDPNRYFTDNEVSVRVSKNIRGTEVAFYGYRGYWKTPEGMNPATVELVYPKLSAYGASVRSTLLGGIGNAEIGYYDSRQDRGGDDPMVRNSEWRFLVGFERELMRDFTGGMQYYVEWMEDYDTYKNSLKPLGLNAKDEVRHLLTLRLTKLLMNQNLKLSFFGYYSPSDEDAYLRPKVHYKMTDQWAAEIGGNIFLKQEEHTFFGQFYKNNNVYAGLRWGF